ncbi:hypothetical protein DFH06DRAFT_309193 [Mycena polygramma]|nr:hypothetical protein DFH06DRAFT_309193 [Mycena polygramma]
MHLRAACYILFRPCVVEARRLPSPSISFCFILIAGRTHCSAWPCWSLVEPFFCACKHSLQRVASPSPASSTERGSAPRVWLCSAPPRFLARRLGESAL